VFQEGKMNPVSGEETGFFYFQPGGMEAKRGRGGDPFLGPREILKNQGRIGGKG
jgi:hypothetical protein